MDYYFCNLNSNKNKSVQEEKNDRNSFKDENNTQNDDINGEEPIDKSALIKELNILNFTLDNLHVLAVSLFINIEFLNIQIARVTDQINDTNFAEGLPNAEDWPRFTNLIFLYVTGLFLLLNYNLYQETLSPESNATQLEETVAFRRFLSSLLIFIAGGLSKSNLEV